MVSGGRSRCFNLFVASPEMFGTFVLVLEYSAPFTGEF